MSKYSSSATKREGGFGSVVAVVILVVMSTLAVAIVKLGTTQQLTSAQDVLSSRAWAAARTGTDWGLFKALSGTTPTDTWKICSGLSGTLNLSATTGFWVAVTCNSTVYQEGESPPGTSLAVRVYVITATACNSSVSCPDPAMATTADYVERVRQVTATNLIQSNFQPQ